MGLNYKTNCITCQTISKEAGGGHESRSALYKLINQYQLKVIKLVDIENIYPQIHYAALSNHAKKHQPFKVGGVERLASQKIAKDVQKHHSERRQEALATLDTLMKEGELKGATYTALATLLKQEMDIEERQKDRSFEVMKLMAKFQSGEFIAEIEEEDAQERIAAGRTDSPN